MQVEKRKEMRTLDVIVAVLLVVGVLNRGLVGLFGLDLAAAICRRSTFVAGTIS